MNASFDTSWLALGSVLVSASSKKHIFSQDMAPQKGGGRRGKNCHGKIDGLSTAYRRLIDGLSTPARSHFSSENRSPPPLQVTGGVRSIKLGRGPFPIGKCIISVLVGDSTRDL